MLGKPIEFWIAIFAASLYVFDRAREKPLLSRLTVVAVSAGLGTSVAPDAMALTGLSETLCAVLLTTLGYLVLDFLTAIIGDREFLKSVIVDRLKRK